MTTRLTLEPDLTYEYERKILGTERASSIYPVAKEPSLLIHLGKAGFIGFLDEFFSLQKGFY